ncbi:hypothetical protein HK101_010844 [Irineochytrium annulatum]|nr:hypothetical protein HK101_010844 [Irineochytrium annulatum]
MLESIDIPAAMEAHTKREKEKEAMHRQIIASGARSTVVAATLLGGSSLALERYSPWYHRQRLPFKAFVIVGLCTGVFFLEADREAVKLDRQSALEWSVTRRGELGGFETEPVPVGLGELGNKPRSFRWDELRSALVKHRFEVVGWGYFGCLAGTLIYQFSKPHVTLPQKLINARLTAQFAAVVGVIGAAALASTTPQEEKRDPYFDRIVYGDKGPQQQQHK